jgi:polar amino acid transport system permease protein
VPRGQTEASIALNLSSWHRMRRIILPQAFRIMLPSFGNMQIQLLKASAGVSLITLADLTFQANLLRQSSPQNTTLIFVILLVVYYLLAIPLRASVSGAERLLSKADRA